MEQKIENQLNLALALNENEREQTDDLNTGFDENTGVWELIIRYSGDIETAAASVGAGLKILSGGYALAYVRENRIEEFAGLAEVIYVEKPKKLYFGLDYGVSASCIDPLQTGGVGSAGAGIGGLTGTIGADGSTGLTGAGTIVAVIDSGIDYAHPDFINEDGTTRIIELFDETDGRVYGRGLINEALSQPSRQARLSVVPSVDVSGHGTHVAGIAAGSGRVSGGRYRGVAYGAELLVVKLGNDDFFSTARLMEGIGYVIRKAAMLGRPVAVNLSFGNNYGAHDGTSLLETYLNEISETWQSVIVAGSGNEAAKGVHTGGTIGSYTVTEELVVGRFEPSIDIQLWKSYSDDLLVTLVAPDGQRIGPFYNENGIIRYLAGNTAVYVYYGEPAPYSTDQEIFIQLAARNEGAYITSGIWRFELDPIQIKNGRYDMWLPAGSFVSTDTRFAATVPDITLTIPSTAYKLITVGAYNARLMSYADFSGRGYTRDLIVVKPEIVAPGVGITAPSPGGGYVARTGTSMAAPFVTGSAALLMEWGIVRGNDPYLYGEKVKAYLIRGARPLPGEEVPSRRTGWGALCVRASIP